ncbi:beta-1,3-glucanosyltransferase [Drechmeria coniospora]|uniref:1,3-beta-glucanosyltransferase n=1 Tax=Drechmeria coniospora TaxID=98403 RepID=A0A151GJ14_DRECN|nr:beta-1,3-glucanosyltransferase [Drechmeria coniospora]KYK57113.1 beta-1,3-glucanosyltransferase [Drechmeria coniospora]ODA79019.1 hypothetical protein RJ55_04609 [Drechmeria coniospora]
MALTKLSLALLALAGSVMADLQPIEMKGSKFFYKNGTQFFMKGVAYQQDSSAAGATNNNENATYVDPLADTNACKRDVPLLKELGTNTIRTYAIDPTLNHDGCMKLLQDAGIYVISDLGEPGLSINRDNPEWNTELFNRYQRVVDNLAKYSNVIGFFAGNEVSNNRSNTDASAYVKAAVRDTKAYIKFRNYRWMGVGYAANDDVDIRQEIADYFNCGPTTDSIDFWGYNIYSWCGESDMEKSGYTKQTEFFQNYSVPVFFAEYGCNLPDGAENRIFQETEALYSDAMTPVFSGGIVYMYFQETNDYGVVKVGSDGKATKQKDFSALKTQVNKADPKAVDRDSYTSSNKPANCPTLSDTWKASGKKLPPTPDVALCDCMSKSRSCVKSKNLGEKSFGAIFGFICGADPEICTAIKGNASTGVYGAYSMCTDAQKLNYVLDAYYQKQSMSSSACDFKGQAVVQAAAQDSSCTTRLNNAADINKQAANAANGTGDSDSPAVLGAPMARLFSVGGFAVSFYMLAAMLAGVAVTAL